MIGRRYADAAALAAFAHGDQVRKGTSIPYIAHPLAVSALVLQHGGDEDQAIIALFHDVVEDCGGQWATTIRQLYGDRIYLGVIGCSDCAVAEGHEKAPWELRKRAYIAELAAASPDVLLVSLCDKLHNAGCIVADLEVEGVETFRRFKAGQDGTIWYYDALSKAFRERLGHHRAVDQLRDMVGRMKALAGVAAGASLGTYTRA